MDFIIKQSSSRQLLGFTINSLLRRVWTSVCSKIVRTRVKNRLEIISNYRNDYSMSRVLLSLYLRYFVTIQNYASRISITTSSQRHVPATLYDPFYMY